MLRRSMVGSEHLATASQQVTGVITIAEADPDPAAASVDVDGGCRVLEVTVELNGRKSI